MRRTLSARFGRARRVFGSVRIQLSMPGSIRLRSGVLSTARAVLSPTERPVRCRRRRRRSRSSWRSLRRARWLSLTRVSHLTRSGLVTQPTLATWACPRARISATRPTARLELQLAEPLRVRERSIASVCSHERVGVTFSSTQAYDSSRHTATSKRPRLCSRNAAVTWLRSVGGRASSSHRRGRCTHGRPLSLVAPSVLRAQPKPTATVGLAAPCLLLMVRSRSRWPVLHFSQLKVYAGSSTTSTSPCASLRLFAGIRQCSLCRCLPTYPLLGPHRRPLGQVRARSRKARCGSCRRGRSLCPRSVLLCDGCSTSTLCSSPCAVALSLVVVRPLRWVYSGRALRSAIR